MMFFGEEKKIEIEIPFNAPTDRQCRISVSEGDLFGEDIRDIEFDICNQYAIQGQKFSDAIISNGEVPVSLEDAHKNTTVIEAVFDSERAGTWISI